MKPSVSRYIKLLNITAKNSLKSFLILLVSLLLTYFAASYTKWDVEKQSKKVFEFECHEIKTKIITRLFSHAQLLRSGSAFFSASDTITREEWKRFYSYSHLNKNLPGIQGLGFSVIVQKNNLQKHLNQIRNEGFPDYNIRPAGDRDVYTSIIYLEPFADRNLRAFGYDMYSEPIRRAAMEKARDFDVATLSGKVILVQETNVDLQAGTLMYVPVYKNSMPANTVEERRAAIIGWVYSPYRMHDLMDGIIGQWDNEENNKIHLHVYDNDTISEKSLLYDSQKSDTIKETSKLNQTYTVPIEFNGKIWTLVFHQLKEHPTYYQNRVFLIYASGLAISLLVFFLSLAYFNTRQQAHQIAKQLTKELQESEEKFRSIIENLPDGILLTDASGNIIECNQAMQEMMNLPISKLINKKIWDIQLLLVPKEKRTDELHKVYRTIFQKFYKGVQEIPVNKSKYILYTEEKSVHIQQSIFKAKTTNGFRVAAICRDITDLELAMQSLKENTLELRNHIDDKDRFMTILAHDLKAPFNSILGFLNLLSANIHKYDINKIEKQINIINTQAQKTYDLLEDILLWARTKSGKIHFEPKKIFFIEVCNKVKENLKLSASNKNITINISIPENLYLFGDINMVTTIVRNLVSNAIKFTNIDGQINIEAKENAAECIITISDNGIGIPEDILPDIFDSKQKSIKDGTASEKGTGLGLLICKEFVEKQGGKIWVESKLDKGSKFMFTLPLCKD